MTLIHLTLRSGLRSMHRYVNYITACTFGIMVFYMFSAFILNPAVRRGYMASTAKDLLGASQFIIIVFAIFFIFFFHSALLRLRSNEFVLFLTLGMIPNQIGRLIFVESMLLGAFATCAGLLFGILFSKLFLLIMGAALLLPQQIPFVIPRESVSMTIMFFSLVFICEAYWVSRRIKRSTPQYLILGRRKEQNSLRFSVWWILFGVISIFISYYMAIHDSQNFVADLFIGLVLTSVGTYLLFSQTFVMVLTRIRGKPLGGVGMLIVSRLAYRLKDNARVLTIVTMLTTIVLTGITSVVCLEHIIEVNSLRVAPFNMMIATKHASLSNQSIRQIRQVLNHQGLQTAGETETSTIVGKIQIASKQWLDVQIVSSSIYDALRAEIMKEPSLAKYTPPLAPIDPGHAKLFVPYPLVVQKHLTHVNTEVRIGNFTRSIHLDDQSDVRLINRSEALPDLELVVSNRDYSNWSNHALESLKWNIYGFHFKDWKNSENAINQIKSIAALSGYTVSATVEGYEQTQQVLSVMLFAGLFISILFFLTAGGTVYFRLDSQQDDDRRQFRALQRIGLMRKEIGRVLTIELFLLFFVPVAIALLHSSIAIVALSHLVPLTGTGWVILGSVVCIYCILMFIYFIIARVKYLKRVTNETNDFST